MLAAAQDASTNTSTIGRGAGVQPRRPPAKKKLLTVEQIVGRMRVSYPALTAARFDPHLKQMFLAELISQSYNDGT